MLVDIFTNNSEVQWRATMDMTQYMNAPVYSDADCIRIFWDCDWDLKLVLDYGLTEERLKLALKNNDIVSLAQRPNDKKEILHAISVVKGG